MSRFATLLGLSVVLTAASAAPASAQEEGTLSVRVRADSAPLAGAQVFVLGLDRGGFTNAEGEVMLRLPFGEHRIRVQVPGFSVLERIVRVVAGASMNVAFDLSTPVVFGYEPRDFHLLGRTLFDEPVYTDALCRIEGDRVFMRAARDTLGVGDRVLMHLYLSNAMARPTDELQGDREATPFRCLCTGETRTFVGDDLPPDSAAYRAIFRAERYRGQAVCPG